jgi:uncharacterized flavoprotein (TIGR03862 family)
VKSIAIVGGGPAMLMAADVLSEAGVKVDFFEKRKAIGWKLLVAGSSGLNVGNAAPLDFSHNLISSSLKNFPVQDWIAFLEKQLESKVLLGTSKRYLVEEKTSASLLKRWRDRLANQGVQFHFEHELIDFNQDKLFFLLPSGEKISIPYQQAILGLGGGSWEDQDVTWPEMFRSKGVEVAPFESCNVGYEVRWKSEFLKEAQRLPLKDVLLKTSKGEKRGDILITPYGMEGTPVYYVGITGVATLDLRPNETQEVIFNRLEKYSQKSKIKSPFKLAKKYLNLSEAAFSLLFHHGTELSKRDLAAFVAELKHFSLELLNSRPLSEAISSRGGVRLEELNSQYGLKSMPNVFLAGEMLDWEAPTGGYLITTCAAQGHFIAKQILAI